MSLPERAADALSGTAFATSIYNLPMSPEREEACLTQIAQGNIPSFLREPYSLPIEVSAGGISVSFWALSDYIAIGSDDDFVRVPLSRRSAEAVARLFNAALPTPKMVDAIFAQATMKLLYLPMDPGPEMSSTAYFVHHSRLIDDQITTSPMVQIAGHKKDVVLCNALWDGQHDDRVAIYGWCKQLLPDGGWEVVQPLNASSHSADYWDYSHGIRLVDRQVSVGGKMMDLLDVLQDETIFSLFSGEAEPFPAGITNSFES